MNNSVTDRNGKVMGFRCGRCGEVYESMWGTVCNECRDKNEKHSELIKEIQELKKQLATKAGFEGAEKNGGM